MPTPVCVALSATHLHATLGGVERCRRPVDTGDHALFQGWISRYQTATGWSERLTLGQELWRWLDGADGWLSSVRDESPYELWLEFAIEPRGDRTFLNVAWELLADDTNFLALRETMSFSVVRRLARPQPRPDPSLYRPALVFMASDPRENQNPLNYDAEEQAILSAIGAAGVDFLCEDTGTLKDLVGLIHEQTEGEGGVEIVHLSCHGMEGAQLALETELGEIARVAPREIAEAFGEFRPHVLFLSACLSAESDESLGSLASNLAERGFRAVIGWAGKVADTGATHFAAILYHRLAERDSVELAVAVARRKLGWHSDKDVKSEWHKARVFLGATGGGPVTKGKRRRHWLDADLDHKAYLDPKTQRVRVASRQEFVGRRRPTQDVLRSLREHKPTLIQGLGQHGKSSLAARIASRYPSHDHVVVFGDYSPIGILQAILTSVGNEGHDGATAARRIIEEELPRLDASGGNLSFVLARLLKGPFRELEVEADKPSKRPILMVVDDFEQALEPVPGGRHRVKPGLERGIAALISGFAGTGHSSLLLFTSRFQFTCKVDGQDAAQSIRCCPLPDMTDGELLRQLDQLLRLKKQEGRFEDLSAAVDAAFGSPSLMSRAVHLGVESKDAFDRLVTTAQEYRRAGTTTHQVLVDFLERLAIRELLGFLSVEERELLRRSTLFEIPVPLAILGYLHPHHQTDPARATTGVERLGGLGLLNRFENPMDFRRGYDHALIDPLVRFTLSPESATS